MSPASLRWRGCRRSRRSRLHANAPPLCPTHDRYATAVEPAERPLEAFVATVQLRCETGEQVVQLIKRLARGIELDIGAELAPESFFDVMMLR